MNATFFRRRRALAWLSCLMMAGQPLLASAQVFKYQVPLVGNNLEAATPGAVRLTPGAHQFGTLVLGSSASTTFEVRNVGQDSVQLTGFEVGAPFSQSNSCPHTLVGGAACNITVTYRPETAGAVDTALVIRTADTDIVSNFGLQGTAVVPTTTLSLSSNSVNFVDSDVGVAASNKQVTITNTGNSPATVTGIGVTDSTEFNQSNNCGATLAPGAKCAITLAFTPAAYGERSGNLSVYEQASGTLYSVSLMGSGNAAVMVLAPSSQDVGSAIVEYSTKTAQVSVSNTGNRTITGLSFDASPADFKVTGKTCGTTLDANSTCTATVTFLPKAAGARTGTVSAYTTNTGSGSVSVTGTGIAQAPAMQASVPSLSFADTPVDGVANAQEVKFTNTGNVPVAFSGVSISKGSLHYTTTSTCPAELAPGTSCQAAVTFAPREAGAQAGVLRALFATGAIDTALSGTSTLGFASVSPSSLVFADQQVATTSVSKSVVVTNTGNRKLTFAGVGIAAGAADFAHSNNCDALAPAGTCTINVTFTPSKAGALSGTLALTHDGVDSVTLVDLAGIGQAQAAALTTPSFSATPVNGASTAVATLSNTGIGPLAVTVPTAASTTGPGFSLLSTTCGTSIAVGQACTITVSFNPSAAGAATGQLSITTGAGAKMAVLSATGIQGYASVSASSVAFGAQQIGTTSATQSVTVTNTGTNVLKFSAVGVATGTAHFAQSNNCAQVAVGGTCTVNVSFTPSAAGAALTGTLSLAHDGEGITNIGLTGDGRNPSVSYSPALLNAGDVAQDASGSASATLTNTGVGSVTGLQVGSLPNGVSVSGAGCVGTLNAGASCNITVSVPATNLGENTLRFVPLTAANLSMPSVDTRVNGVKGNASLSAAGLTFGNQTVSTTSAAQTMTITNMGTAPMTITGVGMVAGAAHFNQSNTCGAPLAVGASCAVTVAFTPSAAGAQSGTVSYTSTGNGPVSFNVSGTGYSLSNSTASFSPTAVPAGQSSTLTWSTTGAASASVACRGNGAGSGTGLSGSIAVSTSAQGTVTCDVTSTNAAGTATVRSYTLTVNTPYTYAWNTSGWTTPAGCGAVTATRSVWCQRSDGATVADANCTGVKPSASTSSSDYSSCSYAFSYGSWTPSSGCGTVSQTRSAACVRSDGTTVSDAYCGTPTTSRSVSLTNSCSYSWSYSSWSPTSGCGTVNQTRTATCYRSDGVVAPGMCSGTPTTSQNVSLTNSCSYSWSYGAWSSPSGCGAVTQTRSATCYRSDGAVAPGMCSGTPATSQSTTNYDSCTYSANLGGWSACSNSCGDGTQSRSVSCSRSDGATVANSYCGNPATSQSCSSNAGCAPPSVDSWVNLEQPNQEDVWEYMCYGYSQASGPYPEFSAQTSLGTCMSGGYYCYQNYQYNAKSMEAQCASIMKSWRGF